MKKVDVKNLKKWYVGQDEGVVQICKDYLKLKKKYNRILIDIKN